MTDHSLKENTVSKENCFWDSESKKPSLKEPGFVSRLAWNKPLSVYHTLDFRGIDEKDKYIPTKKDEWDAQIWNINLQRRGACYDYFVDFAQCTAYISAHFPRTVNQKTKNYCWRPYVNYSNCVEEVLSKNPEHWIKGSKDPHHH